MGGARAGAAEDSCPGSMEASLTGPPLNATLGPQAGPPGLWARLLLKLRVGAVPGQPWLQGAGQWTQEGWQLSARHQ